MFHQSDPVFCSGSTRVRIALRQDLNQVTAGVRSSLLKRRCSTRRSCLCESRETMTWRSWGCRYMPLDCKELAFMGLGLQKSAKISLKYARLRVCRPKRWSFRNSIQTTLFWCLLAPLSPLEDENENRAVFRGKKANSCSFAPFPKT